MASDGHPMLRTEDGHAGGAPESLAEFDPARAPCSSLSIPAARCCTMPGFRRDHLQG